MDLKCRSHEQKSKLRSKDERSLNNSLKNIYMLVIITMYVIHIHNNIALVMHAAI